MPILISMAEDFSCPASYCFDIWTEPTIVLRCRIHLPATSLIYDIDPRYLYFFLASNKNIYIKDPQQKTNQVLKGFPSRISVKAI